MTEKERLAQRLELIKTEADVLQNILDRFVAHAMSITGETVEGGWTFDYVLNNVGTAEELLEKTKEFRN